MINILKHLCYALMSKIDQEPTLANLSKKKRKFWLVMTCSFWRKRIERNVKSWASDLCIFYNAYSDSELHFEAASVNLR